jgi:hypothetical protein
LVRAAVIHGLIIGIPIWLGLYAVAAGWLFGLVAMYPFFGTVRPMLEHRAYDALCETDFRDVEHGPINRLFGEDLFSRYFGAAGTNKHLLHHWDPGISYTRFADMEAFMLRTSSAPHIEDNRTTYWAAARRMLRTALKSQTPG